MSLLAPIANSQAKQAWKFACWALIPFLGLPLGLIAFIYGAIGWRRYLKKPEDLGIRHAIGGMLLGASTCISNLLGILSILLGLRDLGVV